MKLNVLLAFDSILSNVSHVLDFKRTDTQGQVVFAWHENFAQCFLFLVYFSFVVVVIEDSQGQVVSFFYKRFHESSDLSWSQCSLASVLSDEDL